MTTALEIVNFAYRKANETEVASFSTSQEFPYNIAMDLLNTAIREMNRWGSYWFMETDTALTYSGGVYQYTLSSLSIDPKRIISVRRTASNYQGYLTQMNNHEFTRRYRFSSIATATPNAFSKFGGVLELNTIPDQDYSLKVKHFKDIPIVTATSDTLVIPESDEDVLGELVYAYLLESIGKGDWQSAYTLARGKASSLLADMKEDAGMPLQMPAAF